MKLFGADARAKVEGPALFLTANAVQNIGFALHELATNASKHGALTSPQGHLLVSWRGPETDDRICLDWVERGGPVVQSPQRQGFGYLVITSLVAQALQGTARLELSAEGIRWHLDIPGTHALTAEREHPDVVLMVIASLAVFWAMAQQIGSLMVGGYVAGRMRSRWQESGHEADFRDGLHGGLVWAISVLISALLVFSTAGLVARTGADVAGKAASAASRTADPMDVVLDAMLRPAVALGSVLRQRAVPPQQRGPRRPPSQPVTIPGPNYPASSQARS